MNTENVKVSVTLPRELWDRLLWLSQTEHADETSLLIRAIEQFLQQVAPKPIYPSDEFRNGATTTALMDDDWSRQEEIISQIKAMPLNPNTVHPATKSVEQLLTELATHGSVGELLTFSEWQQLWPVIEEELQAVEHANDIAEGLV